MRALAKKGSLEEEGPFLESPFLYSYSKVLLYLYTLARFARAFWPNNVKVYYLIWTYIIPLAIRDSIEARFWAPAKRQLLSLWNTLELLLLQGPLTSSSVGTRWRHFRDVNWNRLTFLYEPMDHLVLRWSVQYFYHRSFLSLILSFLSFFSQWRQQRPFEAAALS